MGEVWKEWMGVSVIQMLMQSKWALKCCLRAAVWHWCITSAECFSVHTRARCLRSEPGPVAPLHFQAFSLLYDYLHMKLFSDTELMTMKGFMLVLVCLDWHLGDLLKGTACESVWKASTSSFFTHVLNVVCLCSLTRFALRCWIVRLLECRGDYFHMIVVACRPSLNTLISIAILKLVLEHQLGFMFATEDPVLWPHSLVSASAGRVCSDNRII